MFYVYQLNMESPDKTAEQKLIDEYVAQMTEQERLVYEIAIDHLESSFDVVRSIGYKEWLETRNK